MKVYKFKNYDEYVASQKEANEEKQHMSFVQLKTIKKIFDVYGPNAKNILCHGTRRGAEQKYFKHVYPNAEIIGTEIGISDWPMTVQHDFAIPKKEWIGYFDIVYSNSFDHSFDPDKTMTTWIEQLANNGKMFIDWNHDQNTGIPHESDPCSGSVKDFERFLIKHKLSFTKPPLRENIFGRDIFSGLYEITKQR